MYLCASLPNNYSSCLDHLTIIALYTKAFAIGISAVLAAALPFFVSKKL
jgi:hypothetical protein